MQYGCSHRCPWRRIVGVRPVVPGSHFAHIEITVGRDGDAVGGKEMARLAVVS